MTGIERFNSPAKVQRIGNDSVYGGGQDGNVVIASNTTLSRDMYYNNLTINANLNTNGFRVFVKNTLTLNGNIGISGTDSVSTGTTAGRRAINSGNVSTSLGGNSGNNTFIVTQLASYNQRDLDLLLSGVAIDSGIISVIQGGASGADGASGIVTPAGNPGTGSLSRNPGVAGGPGTAGTTPPASAGGLGGQGGALVLISAKTIVGTGSIRSIGQNATVGASSSIGTAGNTAPSQTLTHLVDGSAHYITGDGVSGPHASVTAPNVPHGGHVPSTSQGLYGHTTQYVSMGNVHHWHNSAFGDWHGDHGGAKHGPFTHSYNYFDQTPHVNTLTATFYSINGISHVYAHRPHTGVAYTADFQHTSGAFATGYDAPHSAWHVPAGYKSPASYNQDAYPRYHHTNNHSHNRVRSAGTVSSQGSNVYPGGAGGTAGSSTAGSSGITGGGGGIIIITDSISESITTSVSGGTVSGGGAGQSGIVLTVLNQ